MKTAKQVLTKRSEAHPDFVPGQSVTTPWKRKNERNNTGSQIVRELKHLFPKRDSFAGKSNQQNFTINGDLILALNLKNAERKAARLE